MRNTIDNKYRVRESNGMYLIENVNGFYPHSGDYCSACRRCNELNRNLSELQNAYDRFYGNTGRSSIYANSK